MGSENEWLGGCVRVQLTSNDRKITFAMSCSPGSPEGTTTSPISLVLNGEGPGENGLDGGNRL